MTLGTDHRARWYASNVMRYPITALSFHQTVSAIMQTAGAHEPFQSLCTTSRDRDGAFCAAAL
jgi:hypothetical protein